ncbi:hypothetical protein EDC94DRAFT_594034 [Helicostylum pulchrum]|nr:hypothetical protein EDC94DRAFT_594034 [Helicostylum pulchrum]
MSDGMYSRHAVLNAGAIPASAEELSQRYSKLFQQYSSLKAQHVVLKKAVIKEQASNIALQGNVKEKEKELRKLQEQLDLLAFHNERLTKRIQAVQDSDQKGTHFSILGGSVKKELEKSAQALEEANLDLERKIDENERLHEELTESKVEFTEKINMLFKQMQDLEKRVQELQDENACVLSESKTTIIKEVVDEKEKNLLLKELDGVRQELKEKSDLLKEKDQQIQDNNNRLLSEIQSLRAILLCKVGDLKKDTNLYDVAPQASEALKQLEEDAKLYFAGEKASANTLPSDIANKLMLSTQTYSQELSQLVKQLQDTKNELDALKLEKEQVETNETTQTEIIELQKQFQVKSQEQQKIYDEMSNKQQQLYDQQLKEAQEKLNERTKQHGEKLDEAKKRYEEINKQYQLEKLSETQLEEKLVQQQKELEEKLSQQQKELDEKVKEKLLKQQNEFEEKIKEKTLEITRLLSTIEENEKKEMQKMADLQAINEELERENERLQQEIEEQKLEPNEEEEEVFVYPTSEEKLARVDEEEEEEEEEVFVYRGMDAVDESITEKEVQEEEKQKEQQQEVHQEEVHQEEVQSSKKYDENDILVREEKLKIFYEYQVNNLTEKIQMTDSKAVRFASMYKSIKERLVQEGKEKQMMLAEIERLNKEVKNGKEMLYTTETNYQKQVDTMTEFISSLQEGAEDQQRHQTSGRRHHNSYNNNQR